MTEQRIIVSVETAEMILKHCDGLMRDVNATLLTWRWAYLTSRLGITLQEAAYFMRRSFIRAGLTGRKVG